MDRLDAIGRLVFPFVPLRAESSIREHAEIVDLIEAGASPTEIELLTRQHKLYTVSVYQAHCEIESVGMTPTSTWGWHGIPK